MCAGISLMYKVSGGCRIGKQCVDCAYLQTGKETRGFGGRRRGKISSAETYRCERHPGEEDGSFHLWSPKHTACKYFTEEKKKQIFLEGTDGQLRFL